MDLLTSAADLDCDPRVSKGVVECIRHSFLVLLRLAAHHGLNRHLRAAGELESGLFAGGGEAGLH